MDQGATCTEVGLSLGDDGPLSWKNPKIAISVWLIATKCGTVPHIYHFDLFTSSHFGVLKIQEGGGRHFKKSDQIGSSFWRPNGGRYVHVLFKSNRKSGTASLFMRFLPYFYFQFVSGLFSSVLRVLRCVLRTTPAPPGALPMARTSANKRSTGWSKYYQFSCLSLCAQCAVPILLSKIIIGRYYCHNWLFTDGVIKTCTKRTILKCLRKYILYLLPRRTWESEWKCQLAVNECLADCLSANKDTVQFTSDLDGSLAVDNNVNTYSCTKNTEAFPWWAVDLGQEYAVSSVTVTLPNAPGDPRNYRRSCFIH